MRRLMFFVTMCSVLVTNSFAQQIEVKEPQLIKEAGTEAYYPKFTPDGKTILLTSENNSGLKAFNLKTKQVEQLTTADGAGWNPVVSDDSKTICFRQIDYSVDPFGLASFHSYNLESKQTQQLTAPSVDMAPTQTLSLMKSKAAIKSPVIAYTSEDLQIAVEKGGQKTILTPNGADKSYIWVQLSPDKTKIVYNASETFICDLSGKILANLGKLNAPQWLNNDWVVGMDDSDDGHVVVKSNIIGISVNGKVRQELTQLGDKIAMFPAVSPDGSKIAFNTLQGELYIMEISVK